MKKILIILLTVFIFLGLSFYIYKTYPLNKENNSKYSEKVITIMEELKIKDIVNHDKHSKTLEEMLLNNMYDINFIKEYENIDYIEKNNFLNNVNNLLEKGYNAKEVNNIFNKLSDTNINKLVNTNYQKLEDFYEIKNFDVDNLERYNTYKDDKNITTQDAVTQVNIGLDHDYYTETKEVENPDDITVLVNKFNYLSEDYEPNDLVSLSNGSQFKLRKVAAVAYEELIKYASDNGVDVIPFSGYRSYDTQKVIYNSHVNKNGREKADTYSARPGHSEHQLGLAVDIKSKDYELKRLTKEDAEWINKNCSKFGFIVRYTKEDEYITGYMEETWHLRYVGESIATEVMNLGITYDEYYDLYLTKY